MGLGIGRHRDFEIGNFLESRHQIRGVSIAAGMGGVPLLLFRRVAAQGDNMADAFLPVAPGDSVDLVAVRPHTGEMSRRFEIGLAADARHRGVGALAGAAAGAIGHRYKLRSQGLQPLDGGPQGLFHFLRLGRKKLERDLHAVALRRRHGRRGRMMRGIGHDDLFSFNGTGLVTGPAPG